MPADPLPPLPTRVGHADFGDNRFHGVGAVADLVGRDTYWSTVSLGLGGRRLGADEASLLDELACASIAADPRIWPMKLSRLLSAHGGLVPGLVGPLVAMVGGRVGPPAIGACAHLMEGLRAELGPRFDDDEALRAALGRRLAGGGRLPGFGVPYRPEDERVAAVAASMARRGLDGRPWWRLLRRMEAVTLAERAVPANIGAAISAACLDLGFSAAQVDVLAILLLLNNLVANAWEGAAQAPAVLRRLPPDRVRYEGPPPRRSPRAAAADGEAG